MNESDLDRALTVKARLEKLFDEAVTLLDGGVEDAFLDDVRGKLLLSEGEDLAVELGDDGGTVDRLALLDDPLDNVLRTGKHCQFGKKESRGRRRARTLPY